MVTTRRTVISSRYLSEDERIAIGDLQRAGLSVREVAAELGRSPSTISRELRRNRDAGSGRYRPFAAHKLAADRRSRPRPRRLAVDVMLRDFVQEQLTAKWSPEQISHALTEKFPAEPTRHLVPESIYRALYSRDACLNRRLRSGRHRRRPHRQPDERRRGGIVDMTMIDERPVEVEDRVEPGHWEGDMIMGTANKSAIVTLVERTSRNVILIHLDRDRTAMAVNQALITVFGRLPPALRRSLTWDQGKEMSCHLDLTRAVDMPVFFCQKASPWQRGSNENMNGLLRDYFPKGTDLWVHSAERLATVAAELNDRPRKTLAWATPAELFGLQSAA